MSRQGCRSAANQSPGSLFLHWRERNLVCEAGHVARGKVSNATNYCKIDHLQLVTRFDEIIPPLDIDVLQRKELLL